MSEKQTYLDLVKNVATSVSAAHTEAVPSPEAAAAGIAFRLQKEGSTIFEIPREDKYFEHYAEIVHTRAGNKDNPIYLETEDDGDPAFLESVNVLPAAGRKRVSRILLPRLRRVADIREGQFLVEVRLKGSPLKLVMLCERFKRFEPLLRESHQNNSMLLITDDPDTHEVLDVSAPFDPLGREAVVEERRAEPRPLSLKEATEEFDRLAQAEDIPFDYPDEYCTVRAHEMFRRLRDRGVACEKIWNFGGDGEQLNSGIRVFTPNHPEGLVPWGFHVALLIRVRLPNPKKTEVEMVLDPSLADRPVRLPDWLALQHDSTAIHEKTGPEVFNQEAGGKDQEFDDDFKETDRLLVEARELLRQRKLTLKKEELPARRRS